MAPTLAKSLSRLGVPSLIKLCLQWLSMHDHCTPYLQCNRSLNESEEEDYLFPPAESVDELRKIYQGLRNSGADKSHIIDRIIDGDWRRGLSLQQLAMVDFAVLEQSDTALRWSALRLAALENAELLPKGIEERAPKRRKVKGNTTTSSSRSRSAPKYPSIQPSTFVAALRSHISPLVKAHYHLHRLPAPYNLSIVRIYISSRSAFAPTAGNIPRSARQASDASRVIYIALPESCPYVYISLSASGSATAAAADKAKKTGARSLAGMDLASMKRCILESIPKALSRPHERWALEPTKLTAKSLHAICALRGSGRPGTAGGAYSKFSTDTHGALGQVAGGPKPPAARADGGEADVEEAEGDTENVEGAGSGNKANNPAAAVTVRFGDMADNPQLQHRQHASLDRFHVRINDLLRPPDDARVSTEAAPIGLSFAGGDVFLGLRQLASLGDGKYIDLDRLPSWMTGEMGVSVMTVQ
ncbi:hypothetical protein DV735_g3310, partial [Chaetothyriales sp. CBS 134920]